MNAFENIVAQYLESEGYWVKQSVKIHRISKDDKKKIGLPTMPTPEMDIVAFNAKENELLLVEVKSFLDSQGVYFGDDDIGKFQPKSASAKRYRLFSDQTFRRIVTRRLKEEFLEKGLVNSRTTVNYALAVGKFYSLKDEPVTRAHFKKRGWKLFSPEQIKDGIRTLAERSWEDDIVTMTAKLLLR